MLETNEVKSKRYFESSFDTSNPDLKSWFGKVRKGNSEIFDTPFAKGESTAHMLAEWKNHLESIRTPWPSLWEFEIDLADKVGPMSIQQPLAGRISDIESYYQDITSPGTTVDPVAIRHVIHEWASLGGLAIRGQQKTLENMDLSKNSGSPFFTKKRNVWQETFPCVVNFHAEEVHQALNADSDPGIWNAAAILGWRGQEGGPADDDVKQRVVWMFPFAVNLSELQFYQPFIECAQARRLVPAWVSTECVDARVTRLFDSKGKRDLVVCTDFTKFDQHFNGNLVQCVKQILTRLANGSTSTTKWLEEVFPIKYMIPLAFDWDSVVFGKHGMGSGSGGTNCDETLAHRALQYEAAITAGTKLNECSQCLGDDGILSYPGITVAHVVDSYSSHGLEMNPSKQHESTQDCVYLRRWYHDKYRPNGQCAGVYSTCRALGRLRYLERWMNPEYWDSEAVALRQLSILENVCWHPLKEEFVDFCMKRDKYRLGIDIPHFLDRDRKSVV